MLRYFEDLKTICRQLKSRSISMQHKLMLYFMSIIAAILCVVLVVVAASGLFSVSERHLSQSLNMALDNAYFNVTKQFDHFTAQGIKLSDELCTEIDYLLKENRIAFRDLNNNPEAIKELEQAAFTRINSVLDLTGCSGAYMILDVTVNTEASGSDSSRSGVYVRRTSLNDCTPVNSYKALFRGVKEVARKNNVELHNRWHMEYDTEKFPLYREIAENPSNREAGSYIWTRKHELTDTWEDIMLLVVPIVGSRGEFYGLCGMEVSSLYFQLAYPSHSSEFGSLVTVLSPKERNKLLLSEGLCGANEGGKFTENTLDVRESKNFNAYNFENRGYIGVQRDVTISKMHFDDTEWTISVLLAAENYRDYSVRKKWIWVAVFIFLLALMVFLSVFLSRRYVRPITRNIQAIQNGTISHNTKTGMSEMDELVRFLHTKQPDAAEGGNIPDSIREIFDSFIERSKKLTNAEYNILEYYIDGHQIMEIPDLAYISMSTVRTHNRNIYKKLEVSSKEELMLYIDLIRRCGRLDELRYAKSDKRNLASEE